MSADSKFYYTCDLCERPFRFGPHLYAGRPIPQWGKVMLCSGCEKTNWDGIVPQSHPRFMEKLRAKDVEIVLNKSGWIDIPPRGF
jgi:hypothetical protein